MRKLAVIGFGRMVVVLFNLARIPVVRRTVVRRHVVRRDVVRRRMVRLHVVRRRVAGSLRRLVEDAGWTVSDALNAGGRHLMTNVWTSAGFLVGPQRRRVTAPPNAPSFLH